MTGPLGSAADNAQDGGMQVANMVGRGRWPAPCSRLTPMCLRRLSLPLAIGISGLAVAAPAALAHVQIVAPKQRHTLQKDGPCGEEGGTRSQNVCEFQPGATITVQWDETIEHPGHFRISFDEDGVDNLIDPADYDDFDNSPAVLEDAIPDRDTDIDGNPRYSMLVTLPDVECDNCTLQLIQVMTDKPPWGPGGGNDIYYQCSDLVLSRDAPDEPAPGCGAEATGGEDAGSGGGSPDAGSGGGGGGSSSDAGTTGGTPTEEGGCSTGGSATLLATLLIALAALGLSRRRAVAVASRRRRSPVR